MQYIVLNKLCDTDDILYNEKIINDIVDRKYLR
jgi:hypothetical protein